MKLLMDEEGLPYRRRTAHLQQPAGPGTGQMGLGAQPYEVLEQLLDQVGARRRA
jgi:hypothetical protein